MRNRLSRLSILTLILCLSWSMESPAQSAAEKRPLREVFLAVAGETGYRILYREALVSGKSSFSIDPDGNWFDKLEHLLREHSLSATIDRERKQVVIYDQSVENTSEETVKGYVIDNVTGERLPFATVICDTEGAESETVQTDMAGEFRLGRPALEFHLRVSYVGYQTRTLSFHPGQIDGIGELPVRLDPAPYHTTEILVTSSTMPRAADESVYRGMLEAGRFSPLGEASSMRMLQVLPSVAPGTAMAGGAFIRGSSPDATQVLLDGTVIYNRSHLFGLIDSFNSDAIRTGSFYYGITPAAYQAPPGGTLGLITRSGSLHELKGSAGMSSTAVRGSLEGPLVNGKSSWIFSARRSTLGVVNWPGTDNLIAWGLDIDRENSLTNTLSSDVERVVTPGEYSVDFHDLHGKFFIELPEDRSLMIAAYSGGDRTSLTSERLMRSSAGSGSPGELESSLFDTKNRWGNHSASALYFSSLGDHVEMESTAGFSYYHTLFSKEDFTYQRPAEADETQQVFVTDFDNESELTHWYGGQKFLFSEAEAGLVINGYRSAYLEHSLNRPEYFHRTTQLLLEAYLQREWSPVPFADVTAGARLHYFTDGEWLRFSPRLQVTLFPGKTVSLRTGYSRNFQFHYQLSFYNLNTADIWITATEEQPPTSADLFTTGLYLKPWGSSWFQVEGYLKLQKHLRFHEINVQAIQDPFEGVPWYYDNNGYSRGVEFLFRQTFRYLDFTQSYTLGVTEMQNDRLNEGRRFVVEWDRTHRFNTTISLIPVSDLSLNLSWMYATGVPNRLELFEGDDTPRLGDYSRVDLSIKYGTSLMGGDLQISGGIYNLLNRKNPWYREWVQAVDDSGPRSRLSPVQADVYDLSLQPSFSISYHF